jgi:hypothetical protein
LRIGRSLPCELARQTNRFGTTSVDTRFAANAGSSTFADTVASPSNVAPINGQRNIGHQTTS